MLRNILTDSAVEQIPAARFHILRGRQSCETVARCRMQFRSLMHTRGLIGRDVIYSDECQYVCKILCLVLLPHTCTFKERIPYDCLGFITYLRPKSFPGSTTLLLQVLDLPVPFHRIIFLPRGCM
jgi:hypothetical protein